MSTTVRILIIGNIDTSQGGVSRKTVSNKAVAEFYVEDLALRITAWEALASVVPESGRVIVEGKARTRSYEKDGQTRKTTEVSATTIEVVGGVAPETPAF